MKKYQKLLAILLCLVMTVSMFAGCGKTEEPAEGPKPEAGTETPAEEAEKEEPAKMRELSVMGCIDTPRWENIDNQPIQKALIDALAERNIVLDMQTVAKEQYPTTLQTTMAAGKNLPDMVNLFGMDVGTAVGLGKSGVLQDVKPLIDQYSDGTINERLDVAAPGIWDTCNVDGKAYWFPFALSILYENNDGFYSPVMPMIRTDWLEQCGLELPETTDEFIEAIRAFQENDMNGNGQKDEVARMFSQQQSPFDIWGPVFGLPTKHIDVDPVSGHAVSPWLMKDKLVPYFEFWRQMAEEGLMDVNLIGSTFEAMEEQEKLNRIASIPSFVLTLFVDHNVLDYGGTYRPCMPLPEGLSEEEQYVMTSVPTSATQRMAITRDCKDVEAAVDFMDFVYDDQYCDWIGNGLEGTEEPPEGVSLVDWWDSGHARGGELWLTLLGGMQIAKGEDMTKEVESYPDFMWAADKYARGEGPNRYFYDYTALLAPPTDEEQAQYVGIMNDLATYMDEVALKLVTGEYDIADIDQYIDTMKKMGLEDAVAIVDAQANR